MKTPLARGVRRHGGKVRAVGEHMVTGWAQK